MERKFLLNSACLLVLLAGLTLLSLIRIALVQTNERKRYADYRNQAWHRTVQAEARRGRILARDGKTVLAGNIKRARVIIERALLKNPETTAERLSPYLGSSAERLLERITGPDAPQSLELADDITPEIAETIDALNLAGVFIRYYQRRYYPFGAGFAPQTIGYFNPKNGLTLGLENTFDDTLQGKEGRTSFEKDGRGRPLPGTVLADTPAVDGEDIVTTLDPEIQQIAEDVLTESMESARAAWGLIGVMDPRDGELLAVASQPAFDPNQYAQHGSRGKEANPLVHYVYEPGSVFKPLVSAVALDRGWLSPDEKFNCTPTFTVGSHRIHEAEHDHNPAGFGLIPIRNIIVHSSNVGMAQVGLKLGQERLDDIFRTLGFYEPAGIELPAEHSGLKPRGWKSASGRYTWPEIAVANAAFGQGIAVTPLQLMRAYAAIANGGYLVRPTLVASGTPQDRSPAATISPAGSTIPLEPGETLVGEAPAIEPMADAVGDRENAAGIRILSQSTTAEMRRILQQVVREGTGKRAAVPNFAVGGKTGTGQLARNGEYVKGRHNATFIGLLPGAEPRYLILVIIAQPRGKYYASEVAAPAFAQVAMRLAIVKNLPPECIDETR